ncbi:unnamed protein product [Penicillium camemberti]|uniref:Str. FM013 n=1 Tax=Penicillium camemberti (strain FM 013) TaxID=1429867 RepID=A0A0G4PXI8_PENC3|nr:unnamed protein product [Penicillium camemberti]
MDYPTLSSPIDRPAKRQRRVSQDAKDQSKLEIHPQQSSNGTTVKAKVALKLLDLYSMGMLRHQICRQNAT